jgi:23S rRNA pseudouridine1911/1915/1917 synthase
MNRVVEKFTGGQGPLRVDQYLALQEKIESRGEAQRLIKQGRVLLNGKPVKPSVRLVPGDVLIYELPDSEKSFQVKSQQIPLPVLYEDDDLIVVNKPPGLVVHPAPGHPDGTLVNALLFHAGKLAPAGGARRPGIVHRLDKGTSGVIIAAKTNQAFFPLVQQFQRREIEKVYLAMVYGSLEGPSGIIEHAISRNKKDRKKMAVTRVTGSGRAAVTRWKLKKAYSGLSFLALYPKTGRTHQLRVHLSSLGHPIVGDPVYGRKRLPTTGKLAPLSKEIKCVGRQALHAWRVTFSHPVSQIPLTVTAPCPDDLKKLHQKIEENFLKKEP